MKTSSRWQLIWKGKDIAIVKAANKYAAISKAPMPYKQYYGEVTARPIIKEK